MEDDPLELIAGLINRRLLHNLTAQHTSECSAVLAAIAYADGSTMDLLAACDQKSKPLTFYGRYDYSAPVSSRVLRWFLDKASLNLTCKLVPDFLHAKVIWWVGVGAYIGSANLTERAWTANVEAGTFVTQEEMEATSMIEELRLFFDEVENRSIALDDKLHKHIVDLERRNVAIDKAVAAVRSKFDETRLIPPGKSLGSVDRQAAEAKAFQVFQQRWRDALQVLRNIATRASQDSHRPAWVPEDTPAGAQADQFIHAYYYRFIRGGQGGGRVDDAFNAHRDNPDAALREALDWWRSADFNYEHEERTLLTWAPRLRELLAKDRLLSMTKEEFVEAMSMIHAVREYAGKRPNRELGFGEGKQPQPLDLKIQRHANQLWEARSETGGKTPLEVFHYVLWGTGEVEERRIWTAARDPQWRLPWVQFSSLGEMLGWARPTEFPPRNDRTLKGLRALGYPVRES